jgi:hypothetical protein
MASSEPITGSIGVTIEMTSTQAAEFVRMVKENPDYRKKFEDEPEAALRELGIDGHVFERIDPKRHEFQLPEDEDLFKIIDAIQTARPDPLINPPAFAACSRIALIAYASAAAHS